MANIESVSLGNVVLCRCRDREYTTREIIDSALFRGELSAPWEAFLEEIAADKRATELDLELDDDAFDAAAESFRYQHDLITAEETEHWLAARGLTLDDFSDYFVRRCWADAKLAGLQIEKADYVSAPPDLRDRFSIDLILSGQLQEFTTRLGWRLAVDCAETDVSPESAAAEKDKFLERVEISESQLAPWLEQLGRDEQWLEGQARMEAAFCRRRESLVGPQTHARELSSLRLPLTKFETEVIELESADAAKEALFCVREDGMSMEEVANEGRYPFRRTDFLLEDLDAEAQQRFLSAGNGQLLDPIQRGDGFELCRVIQRIEPQADDPGIQSRIEQRILTRHFAELSSKHVTFAFAGQSGAE